MYHTIYFLVGEAAIRKASNTIIKQTNSKDSKDNKDRNKKRFFSNSSNKSSKVKLRSRNDVIDNWLDDEDGSDTYADLEDFLVK